MESLVFKGRPHAASGERTYELSATHLTVSEPVASARRIPLSEIEEVALSYMGTGQGRTYCNIKTRRHGTIHIRSHHFAGLGAFEDRHESFDPFLSALCRAVAEKNPKATFHSGSWLYFGIWFAVFLIAAGFAIGFLNQILSTGDFEAEPVMGVVVGIGLACTALAAALANKVEPFDPKEPPVLEYE